MNNLDDDQIAEIEQKIAEFRHNIIDFIKADEYTERYNIKPGYNKINIDTCIVILNKCFYRAQKSNSTSSVRREINWAVIRLNLLHITTKFRMIETMEREDLAEILNLIGYYRGAIKKDHDQTEKLRI